MVDIPPSRDYAQNNNMGYLAMRLRVKVLSKCVLCYAAFSAIGIATADDKEIPEALKPWKAWVTWGDNQRNCPTPYNAVDKHICFWPSKLSLTVDQGKATWTMGVNVYDETWVPLPGSGESWPLSVLAEKKPIAVLERKGKPFVRLVTGPHQISGEFQWNEMPQRVALPKEVGVLSLTVDGKAIDVPNWDADGDVWLKRQRAEAAEKDLLAARVYRVMEDSVPIWLRTEIELTVSGKSREESLGWILPDGWQLSYVESPIPVAVDQEGRLKAQVRAGKWMIAIDAFRTTDVGEFRYPPDAKPVADVELIGWKAQPSFRSAEFSGIQAVDVTQTTFPAKWRELPVYEWKTNTPFKLVQKMRGMGLLRPPGLTINRRFWLDDDGRGLTYHDTLSGQMQQIWRLDAAAGEELGAVRIDGQGQLVTADPKTGAHGVEIRNRNLNMEAIGRTIQTRELSATGWNTDADSLRLTLILPPGWRVFALFGADNVQGDWLTAWTLLDLFLLLIFSLAVLRLWGFKAGLVALLAFGLAFHEMGAPRYTWLFLLMPLALLRVVPEGTGRRWIVAWKYFALLLLALCLVPFLALQIQTAIYPQLETPGIPYTQRTLLPAIDGAYESSMNQVGMAIDASASMNLRSVESGRKGEVADKTGNLLFDPNAKIQTGPAEPGWTWNQVYCEWNGPVAAGEKIKPILISLFWHRIIMAARIALLVVLVSIVLSVPGRPRFGLRRIFDLFSKRTATAAAVVLLIFLLAGQSFGQNADKPAGPIPDKQMLDTLRDRLLEPSDAYPHTAEIASAELQVRNGRITVETEVHAALDVAVPLPGRFPTWSPVTVKIDDKQGDIAVCRREGYLWANVPKVVVEGLLADTGEWEWTFLLRPRRVLIDAPDWNVTGVRPNGIPEQQVFFTRKQRAAESQAAYDRKDFYPIVAVERQIEVGLIWKVHNTVTRLSSSGKAVSLKVPLLAGESVLTSNVVVQRGQIDVRLAAGETKFQWDSELPITQAIQLSAQKTDQWVERWQLVASPVWNVALAGLAPVFEPQQQMLIPTWQPWPGEEIMLSFTRPQAISGDTVTVQSANHEISLGDRQRTTKLKLDLECSLGSDLAIALSPEAEITSLTLDGRALPVRREGRNLVVPSHLGKQSIEATWRTAESMQTVAKAEPIALPVAVANITTVMNVPESRWVLWAHGPQRGPAVRFWAVLACAVLAGVALGSASLSPLRRIEWVLLAIGLTQVHIVSAMIVVGWLFLLARRGRQDPGLLRAWQFNLSQVGLVLLTFLSLGILIVVAGEGLLGQPEMFIVGNNSTQISLQWFQPRAGLDLPEPYVVSISIWFYRYAMLGWALWLAVALLRWLQWGWNQFTHGGGWKCAARKATISPVVAEVIL